MKAKLRKISAIMAMAAATIIFIAGTGLAIPITGSIGFSGSLTLEGGTRLDNATGIHFINPALVGMGTTGAYAPVPGFPPTVTYVTFKDLQYRPFAATVEQFWKFTHNDIVYDFDLNAITQVTETALRGTGFLGITGYEDTFGSFELTTQSGKGAITFSTTTTVPEPGTILLLGAGLIGLGFFGRRRIS